MKRVIKALRVFCEWGVEQGGECESGFREILDRADWSGPRNPADKAASPSVVDHWLEEAVELAGNNPLGDLGRAILAERMSIAWFSMYEDYIGFEDIDSLRAGYAVMRVTGPKAEWFSDDLTTAITLQAPHTFYPPHAHKQREIYGVIGGEADWQRGAEPWIVRRTGEAFYHPSGVRHATQTHDQPLLAFASWIDDVHLKPVFVTG